MAEKKTVSRCFLYSPDCPAGRIYEGDDAIAAALKDGWVDSPAKLKPVRGGQKKAADNDDS